MAESGSEDTDAQRAAGTSASERLSLSLALLYGAPSFAGAAMLIPIAIHMTKFYSDVVLVPPGFLGIAIAVARALDAVGDPAIGFLCDRTRTRWGRRRPWMLIAAPLTAVFFCLLFTPPAALRGSDALLWFTAMFILYSVFHTAYAIPHYALGPELTLDYHERSTLFGVREAFAVLGTIVASVLPGILLPRFGGDERAVFRAFSVGFSVMLVLLYWLLVARVRERRDFYERASNPLVPGVRRALRNRPFRILLGSYVVSSLTGAIPGTLMPYFVQYVLRPEDPGTWLAILLGAYFGSGFLCLPLWVAAARRFGKRPAWLASFLAAITGGAGFFFCGPGDERLLLALVIWAGSSFGAGLFIGPSIQADVIDYDELHTGKRREAQYAAFFSILPKFVTIPSAAIPIAFLGQLGYRPNIEQTPEVVLAIKSMFALAPAAFSLVAAAIAWRLPITERVHREILLGIAALRRGESTRDPITGGVVSPHRTRSVPEETAWFLDHFSPGELHRAVAHGPTRVRRDVWLALGGSLALAGAAIAWVIAHSRDLAAEPGALTVIAVVVAGIALSAAGFHALRLRPARALATRSDVGAEVIRAHREESAGE